VRVCNTAAQFKQFCNHLVNSYGTDLENAYAATARLYALLAFPHCIFVTI